MKSFHIFTIFLVVLSTSCIQARKGKTKANAKQKIAVEPPAKTRQLSSAELALAGAAATAFGVTIMHPVDTIKTLQQTTAGAGLNIFQAGAKIMKDGGVGAMYSGLGPYVTSDGCAGAFKFAT